jgi:PKD repeat protein
MRRNLILLTVTVILLVTAPAVGIACHAHEPLSVSLLTNKTEVLEGESATFTALPSGGVPPLTYEWDFDDDGTVDSMEQNPTYVYSATGTYTITLKVTDSAGNIATEIKSEYITIQHFAALNRLLVGTYYYPWWKQLYWDDGHKSYPNLDEYDSQSLAVINQHIRWAVDYGIDFFAMSWWGPGSWEDKTLRDYYLQAEESSEIKFCIHYESVGCLNKPPGQPIDFNSQFDESQTRKEKFLSDLDYIAGTFFNEPQYLKINGRPVIIFYSAMDYQNAAEALAQFKQSMDPQPYLIADAVCFGLSIEDLDWDFLSSFDAITGYNMYTSNQSMHSYFLSKVSGKYAEFKHYAESYGLSFIPNVMPGFDDTAIREGRPPLDRNNGQFYKEYWQLAIEYLELDLNAIMITSFNEWFEDTQIEPATEYGMKYLEITKESLEAVP